MLMKVFCASRGALERGGGGGGSRLPGLVTKQQAVEFPQVQASTYIIYNIQRRRNM